MRRLKMSARDRRDRRDRRELNRVLNSASPAMMQEITAAWTRQVNH